jgi:hypothetical protein
MADIGDILHVENIVAAEAQVAYDHVKVDISFSVADMGMIVNCRAADINVYFAGVSGLNSSFSAKGRYRFSATCISPVPLVSSGL